MLKGIEPRLIRAHTLHRVVQIDARRVALQTLLLGLLFCALLTIPFVVYQQAESGNRREQLEADQERVIQLAANSIHREIEAVLSDLRYLSQNNALRTYLAQSSAESRRELAREYQVLARQKRIYAQVRFIGLDGMEAVRVNFNDGQAEIVAERDLQDKHNRYYFQEALWLSPGQIYVSPLDLNREHGSFGSALTPVMRFAAPVADEQGLIRGMVVLNYTGQRLRDKLDSHASRGARIWLLNPEGYWLIGPNGGDEWGFQLADRAQQRADQLLPRLWQKMQTQHSGVYQTDPHWIRFERIYPLSGADPAGSADFASPVNADRYYWTIAVELPRSAIQSLDLALLTNLWGGYAVLVLFAFLTAGMLVFVLHRNRALSQVMEKVVDNLPQLVAYVDAEQRFRFNNMAYKRLFGLSPRELYGRTMMDVLGEAAYQMLRPHVERALAGEPENFESQMSDSGAGRRDMAISYLPDFSPHGAVRGFYVIVSDISLAKESERRERQRILEMARVSRLASMGEMATEIAHEINQPLAAVAMYSAASERVLKCGHDSAQVTAWLQEINTQVKRASEIVRRMRRFVQRDAPRFGPVDLNQVLREAAALLDHEARTQDVTLKLELAENLPSVQGGHVLLEQAVFNLGRRALDALLNHSGIREVTLKTRFDAQRVQVEVRDSGPGLDPAAGDRIFDSFLNSMEHKGNMDLTISRTIVEAHAGTLRHAPNPEGGTIFMFSLAREGGQ